MTHSTPGWQAPSGFTRLLKLGLYASVVGVPLILAYMGARGRVRTIALILGLVALVCLGVAIMGTTVWYARATGTKVWRLVAKDLKEEFRFGHKPWHRMALIVASVPCAYMALIATTVGDQGLAAGFGVAAVILLLLAFVAHRRRWPTG